MKILLLYAGADLQKNGSGEYGKKCSDPPLVIRCLELCSIKRMFKLRQIGTKFFKSYYLRSRLPAHLKKKIVKHFLKYTAGFENLFENLTAIID
jgi:hypothetical protein